MGILLWVLMGLIVGVIAKFIMPGRDSGGFIMTVILGIAGAIVGGWLSSLLGLGSISGFDLRSLVIAVAGALLVLFIWHKIRR